MLSWPSYYPISVFPDTNKKKNYDDVTIIIITLLTITCFYSLWMSEWELR